SDIRGFTPMSETMSPEGIATLLTDYFTEMVEIVFENGGTLDKFIGDAIMALWGAPIAHEDDADRAMQSALDQLTALESLNAKWKEAGRPELGVGIGINFGEVFAGNIGSDRRLEYTVIGDAVNTASRLCRTAGPNEILISEPFYQRLKRPPTVEALEPPVARDGDRRHHLVRTTRELRQHRRRFRRRVRLLEHGPAQHHRRIGREHRLPALARRHDAGLLACQARDVPLGQLRGRPRL